MDIYCPTEREVVKDDLVVKVRIDKEVYHLDDVIILEVSFRIQDPEEQETYLDHAGIGGALDIRIVDPLGNVVPYKPRAITTPLPPTLNDLYLITYWHFVGVRAQYAVSEKTKTNDWAKMFSISKPGLYTMEIIYESNVEPDLRKRYSEEEIKDRLCYYPEMKYKIWSGRVELPPLKFEVVE
jgi:hypothetical protein